MTLNIDSTRDALVIVDVQNDFCPGGALAVDEGDAVVDPINHALSFEWATSVATRDWHPANHSSFESRGGTWPRHCVQNDAGAELHEHLDVDRIEHVLDKGIGVDDPGYSAVAGTELLDLLGDAGVTRAVVGGLATDYCVRATVLDLLEEGIDVLLLEDAVRAVNVQPGDDDRALAEMAAKGAQIIESGDLDQLDDDGGGGAVLELDPGVDDDEGPDDEGDGLAVDS